MIEKFIVNSLCTQSRYDTCSTFCIYVMCRSQEIFGCCSFFRLIVRFDDDMVARFTDEDDFIIEIEFDNQKGHFDLYILY